MMNAKERLAKIGEQVGAAGAAGLDALSRGKTAVTSVTDTAWIHAALEKVPPPASPATEPWEMSLAAFLRFRTDLPELALKPLGLLDRYGALTLGPELVGFDGEEIAWNRVVRIGVREVGLVITESALEREGEKIRELLPPVPGRKWVVERSMEVIGAAAAPLLAGKSAGVVCEIAYKTRLGREKVLESGLFAALLLASRRPIQESFIATALAHGIPISPDVAPQIGSAKELAAGLRAEALGDVIHMESDPLVVLSRALDQLNTLISPLSDADWSRPTPCRSWDAGLLTDHLLFDLSNFAISAEGGAPDYSTGAPTVPGDERATRFREGAAGLVAAWEKQDPSAREAVGTQIAEFAVHAWDLARATGSSTELDPVVAQTALDMMSGMLKPEYRGSEEDGKFFGPEVEIGADAPVYERLVAFSGRNPR